MVKKYVQRTIESLLLKAQQQFPVIVLTGPRQTGKSTTLRKKFKDYNYITFDDPVQRSTAIRDPGLFLEINSEPLIIDEIQYVPSVLPFVKMIVDNNRDKNGLFILTGSQYFPLMHGISESLAGRAVLFELLGLSFSEYPVEEKTVPALFNRIFTGSYPDPLVHKVDPSLFYSSYLQTYIERDIRLIQSVHDLTLFQHFLELLAARIGTILNLSSLATECGVSQTTVKRWISLLESTRILYLLRPYFKNISKRVIKNPKIYFTDTGLVSYLLRFPTYETVMKGPMAGQFFENFFIIEFLKQKVFTSSFYNLYFYRDSNQNEVDLVVEKNRELELYEFKLAKNIKPDMIKSILHFKKLRPEARGFLISGYEKELVFKPDVIHLPWHKLPAK
ncbi:MAG: hypothetical protein DRP87_06695 [Spirochaetes bacterium]|nr:MAG: hypothetical protein DRP87_06695 [Spirochaetota bacterium]